MVTMRIDGLHRNTSNDILNRDRLHRHHNSNDIRIFIALRLINKPTIIVIHM